MGRDVRADLNTHQLGLNTLHLCTASFAVQVRGLEFNSFSPNLLASGAADSDLCIWDLAKPTAPSLYPALKVKMLLLMRALLKGA